MTANPSEYHIGNPPPNFDPDTGGVALKESTVAYRTMKVTDTSSQTNEWGDWSSSYEVTLRKDPETAEDNKVGVPAYYCSKTRINGSWSSEYTSKNGDHITEKGWDAGSWTDAIATPGGATPGTGTHTYQVYDEDGNLTDSGSGESSRTYGPAWYGIWGGSVWNAPESITTTVEISGLRHEVSGFGRTLVVQFQDAHTTESAFAAITTPEPTESDWSGNSYQAVVASFAVGRADEANADMRVTGAAHTIGRYRWRVPYSHTGPKFKFWWDEGFFPKEWIAWDAAGRSGTEPEKPTLTPKSFEWEGPGSADDPNHPSWFTPYSNTVKVPSATEGHTEICNVRFICYESVFGTKPQIDHGFRIYNPDE